MTAFLEWCQTQCTMLPLEANSKAGKDKTLERILQQAKQNKNITQEIASSVVNMISGCMGPEDVAKVRDAFSHLYKPDAPLDSEMHSTDTKPNQPAATTVMQHNTFWHRYLTKPMWSLYASPAGIEDEISATVKHMQ